MNPVIIIPTFICANERGTQTGVIDTYDHMTPLDRQGEITRCLGSLNNLEPKAPVVILVVSEKGVEEQAAAKIRREASYFADLDITVIGVDEERALHSRMVSIGVGDYTNGVGLTGYGAIRNLGLVYAASMGYTEAIFIDDDEVVNDPLFVDKGCYGLGMLTQRGVPILIKSGYYLDKQGEYHAPSKDKWYNRFWRQDKGFNEWIDGAMKGPRLSSSNVACGGCLALHREAFKRVSFDPWIARGEDLDFLINVRMYGSEVWFDNDWQITHLPPPTTRSEARRFIQDSYRWLYENRKLEFSATQIDLLLVQPSSLEPYPGPFLESSTSFNVMMTGILRAIGRGGQRGTYLRAAFGARKAATEYAKEHCADYFAFQRQWPEVVALLEEDIALKGIFENAAVRKLSDEEKAQMQLEYDRAQKAHRAQQARERELAAEAAPIPNEHLSHPYAEPEERPVELADEPFAEASGFSDAVLDPDRTGEIPVVEPAGAEPEPHAVSAGLEAVSQPQAPRREKAKSPFEDILRDYESRNPEAGEAPEGGSADGMAE